MRSADRASDTAIETWLERHGVEVAPCADAFEACTFALTRRQPVPDLVVVGFDWLAVDERRVVEHLHEAWPTAVVVVHGNLHAIADFRGGSSMLVLRRPGDLQRMLAESPDALLERVGNAGQSDPPSPRAWRPNPELADVSSGSETPSPADANPLDGHDKEPLAAAVPPPCAGLRSPDDSAEIRLTAPHTILTREELAALLGNDT